MHAYASLALHARYRLDAAAFLEAKRADAADLDALHAALLERARRDAALDRVAERCTGAWRAWQVRLLRDEPPPAAPTRLREADATYLAALRSTLARSATSLATAAEAGACRLEGWTVDLDLLADPPDVRAADAEAGLASRSRALATAGPPPTLWLELDAAVAKGVAGSIGLRAGVEFPFDGFGSGALALGVARAGPDVAITWRPTALDERIMARHEPTAVRERDERERARLEHFEHRRHDAVLARADADRRWIGACGEADPATVTSCLARSHAALRDDLLAAIDAELGAIHALLALVAASGHDLDDLLRAPSRTLAR